MEVAAAAGTYAMVVVIVARIEGSGEVVGVGKETRVGREVCMARHVLVPIDRRD